MLQPPALLLGVGHTKFDRRSARLRRAAGNLCSAKHRRRSCRPRARRRRRGVDCESRREAPSFLPSRGRRRPRLTGPRLFRRCRRHRTSYLPAIPENSARKSTRLTTVIRIAGSHIPDAIEFITNGRTLAVAIDDLFSRGFAAPPSHRNVLTDGHARLLARMRSHDNSHE